MEHFIVSKQKRLAWLHYFRPEESLSGTLIEITVEFRDHEWINWRVLKIVAFFHGAVAVSDYQRCHLTHFRTKEGLKVREYSVQVASLTLSIVKDPDCINLLCGRRAHKLEPDS